MAVSVLFGGRDAGLEAMNRRVAKSAGEIDENYKAAARESKAFENAALRSVRAVETETERLSRIQAGLNRLIHQGRISQETANRAMAGARGELTPQVALMTRLNAGLADYARGWIGAHTIMQTATLEMSRQQQILERTADATVDLATAQADLISQLQGVDPDKRRAFLQEVVDLGPQLGIRPSILTQQVSELFTATTGRFEDRRERVLATLKQVAPLFLTKPGEIGDFGGAFQAFLQTAREEAVGLTDEDAFSLFLQARSQARTGSIEKLKNLVPAIKAVEVAGEGKTDLQDLKAAISLFALIGSRAEDPDSEKTRTAMVKLVQVMEDRFPDKSFFDQIQAVAGLSERQQRELFEPLSALRGIGPVVKDILSGGRASEIQDILDSLVINADQSEELRRALLTDTQALRETARTMGTAAAAEAELFDRSSAAAVQQRLFGGAQGPGTIDVLGLPGERFLIEHIARAALFLGANPQLVQDVAERQAERGIAPGLVFWRTVLDTLRQSGNTQDRMAESLRSMERNFGVNLSQPSTPEN